MPAAAAAAVVSEAVEASSTSSAAAAAAAGLALFLAGRTCMQYLVSRGRLASRRRVGTVSRVIIYPVKSCLGVSVEQASVEECGLVCQGVVDRSFAVISTATGKCVSLKACPELSRVQPVLDATAPVGIRLTATATAVLDGPAPSQPVSVGQAAADVVTFDMFGETVHGRACDAVSTGWLRRVCGRSDLALVQCPQPIRGTIAELRECQRQGIASQAFANCELPTSGDSRIAFANTAPLMLSTEAALVEINRRLADKGRPGVDWRNFRPNLVVDGPAVDREEEAWSYLFIGDGDDNGGGAAAIAVLSPCTRCGIITVDADTAKMRDDGEPLRTLCEYRKDGAFAKFSPVFGVNGFVERPGLVRVGCEVLRAA